MILTELPGEDRDLPLALEAVDVALRVDPDSEAYLDTRALFQLGRVAEALAVQKEAVAL